MRNRHVAVSMNHLTCTTVHQCADAPPLSRPLAAPRHHPERRTPGCSRRTVTSLLRRDLTVLSPAALGVGKRLSLRLISLY